jgi:hypothetical protein
MSNIVKQNHQIALAGTSQEGIKVRFEIPETLKADLFDEVLRGYKITQTKLPENFNEEIQVTVEMVVPEILEKFGMLTLPEVKQAFKDGFFGEYGTFYGITPLTLTGFLKSYLMSEKRKNIVRESKKENQALPEPTPEVTKDEKLIMWNEAKSKFLKTGEMLGEVYLYRVGRDLGFIDETDEFFIEEVRFKAHKRLEEMRENISKAALSITEKWEVRSIDELLKQLEMDKPIEKGTMKWKRVCRRIAVEITFTNEST